MRQATFGQAELGETPARIVAPWGVVKRRATVEWRAELTSACGFSAAVGLGSVAGERVRLQ